MKGFARGNMARSGEKNKKNTIFQFMLIPLIAIMLIQSLLILGMLTVRKTTQMLGDYKVSMMSRTVENRWSNIQNQMNQRWALNREQELAINSVTSAFLNREHVDIEQVLSSETLRAGLLEEVFPGCINLMQSKNTTGVFFILTGDNMQEAGDYDGFFIRDYDPETSLMNRSDLLLERGNKQLARNWNIPLDTNWTTHFHMEGQGRRDSDRFFYEPWRAGIENPDANAADLGFWSVPFVLENAATDSHKMITYSVPLSYDGVVYGVYGIEVAMDYLYDYFPVNEINDTQQSGYMFALNHEDGSYTALAGRGVLYNSVAGMKKDFVMQTTGYDNLYLVKDVLLGRQKIYAAVYPLKLYGNNAPYEDTQWVLLGLNTEDDLFGMSRRFYFWLGSAILAGLLFGISCIYFLVKSLTSPLNRLVECISRGSAGLQSYKSSNILEVDTLYDVVNDLTRKQKEAEASLFEEKERYKIALESAKDTFFSFDYNEKTIDIVNNERWNGQWTCNEFDIGFIDPEMVYDMDRGAVLKMFRSQSDKLYVECRLKPPGAEDYTWVAISGNVFSDEDGNSRKMVGSVRDIQKQKDWEAEQLRKSTIDSVTGLYVYSAGMKQVEKSRRIRSEGVMICLRLAKLMDINEKEGIVFGDMILEELGNLIQDACSAFFRETGHRSVALRFDSDMFLLWLEKQSRNGAERFTAELADSVKEAFKPNVFRLDVSMGLVCATKEQGLAELIGMAQRAQLLAANCGVNCSLFYEDLPVRRAEEISVRQGMDVPNFGYTNDATLASIALNLFGNGADFPAQMALMLRKIGRYYGAYSVLVTVVRPDFHSNYLEYQWNERGQERQELVHNYREGELESFHEWLGREHSRFFDSNESREDLIQRFLSIRNREQGVVLPVYDSGNYTGNLCILGIDPGISENAEKRQNLEELGNVIQSQLNQKQHDIASKAKSEFLSRMSHEIRTPMNGIVGMTAIALQKDQSQERIMDCLKKIDSSSKYLLGLINDILDMSKIESGKMHLEIQSFDMREMLDTVQELIASQTNAKGIDFVQDIQLAHTWFRGDKLRISQVLINLLGNAVKFTPPEGRITLTVCENSGGRENAGIYFAVKDTGVGIPKEDQRRVFRSFEQAPGANSSKLQGTGLGLSISSRLIRLMGSSIDLESEPGKGSVFSFTIRLELGDSVTESVEEDNISFEGYKILVVEDNELNAEIAQSLLEERKFKVECVYDGAQAVERIRDTAPGTYDLILMDIMMPVMDGLEATRAIRSMDRADCRTIPIIAMSANAFDDDLKKSVECGMNGHLSKPVEVDKLFEMLRNVIHGGRKG